MHISALPAARPREALPVEQRLKITEIFLSIQGEADSVGWPTVFVRLTGCPLRCQYCDTAYAFHGGRWVLIAEVLAAARQYATERVTVTGGEPLAQHNCLALLAQLCDAGYRVSLETSGALPIADVDARVARVVDFKTPGSGECERNLYDNVAHLQPKDQVKFVICDHADFDWSCDVVKRYDLANRCQVLFSPSHEQLKAADLAEWILETHVPVRLQMQLHKYLWGNVPGR